MSRPAKVTARWLLMICMTALALLMTTGCWDRWELEERGMVLGIGLDKAEKAPPIPGVEGELDARGEPVLNVTFQMVDPGQVAGEKKGGGEKGSPYWNLTVESAGSVFEAIREASTRANRSPYLEHVQVLVIGEDLARQGLNKVLDALFRENEIRKRVLVYVTPATAQEVLAVKPRQEGVNAVYLASLQENSKKTSHFPPRVDLGKLSRNIHEGGSYLLPRIIPAKEEVKLIGAGVFKEDKLIGWLGGFESQGVRLVTGQVKGGSVEAVSTRSVPGKKSLDVYEFMELQSTVKPQVQGGQIAFTVQIQTEGRLVEHQNPADTLDEQHLKDMEKEFARAIEKQARLTIEKMQRDFQADVFNFGRALEERYPQVWEQVKNNWSEVFAAAQVEVKAQVNIRRVGISR